MAFWNLQWRSPSNSISRRRPLRAWRNVKLQGLKERRGERDSKSVGESQGRGKREEGMRVKSAGNKHLLAFPPQAVRCCCERVKGDSGGDHTCVSNESNKKQMD